MKVKYLLSLLLLTAGIASTFNSEAWRGRYRRYGWGWPNYGYSYSPYYYGGWGYPGLGFSILI